MSATKYTYSSHELFTNSKQTELYAKFRPRYSDEVFEKILSYCKEQDGSFDLAIDAGCGSGQSTIALTKYFQQVIGIDVSEKQIANAPKNIENLSYIVSSAENLWFVKDESVDLVTAASALHWMDQQKFFKEVTRVLKPNGCLVVYGYNNATCQLSHPEANRYFRYVCTEVLASYWARGRKIAQLQYNSVNLPYPGWHRDDSLTLEMEYSIEDFVGYMGSLSAVHTFQNKHPDVNFLEELKTKFQSCMSQGDEVASEKTRMKVLWPIFMLMGTKPQ